MTSRAGLIPIICTLAMLLAPTLGRAADQPAATAVIPPPAPPASDVPAHVAVHKASPRAAAHRPSPTAAAKAIAGSRAQPRHAAAAKRSGTLAATRIGTRTATGGKPGAMAQRHLHHRQTERRPVVFRSAPSPALRHHHYARMPMPGPDAPLPPLPPPWYDRARPAIAFAYPPPYVGPGGPLPWWVR